jgi:hypothetical protein
MKLDLNIDLILWIDANKGERSRASFIIQKLRELMQDTKPQGDIHTKGQLHDEVHLPNGVNHTPKQV